MYAVESLSAKSLSFFGTLVLKRKQMIHGLGVDIIDISKFERYLKLGKERFLRKVYTPREMIQSIGPSHPDYSLAACFAGKEAVMKALGTGWPRLRWKDIEIYFRCGGSIAELKGDAMETLREAEGTKVLLSISICSPIVVACALAVG